MVSSIFREILLGRFTDMVVQKSVPMQRGARFTFLQHASNAQKRLKIKVWDVLHSAGAPPCTVALVFFGAGMLPCSVALVLGLSRSGLSGSGLSGFGLPGSGLSGSGLSGSARGSVARGAFGFVALRLSFS